MKCMSVNFSHTDMKDANGNSPMNRAIHGYYTVEKPIADELQDGRMELALFLFNHGCNNYSDKAELHCGACRYEWLQISLNNINLTLTVSVNHNIILHIVCEQVN